MLDITCAQSYFVHLSRTVEKLPFAAIDEVAGVLLSAYEGGRVTYTLGNGGSAALASHFACDLGKGTANVNGKRFRVMALTDNVPMMTAWANDSKYDDIFAEQLINFVQPEDVVFAISGSGNSRNVIRALEVAKATGAITVGLTGYQGGAMRELCDFVMVVPSDNMQIIEDIHLCVAHSLFSSIRHKMSQSKEEVA
jgi:D-sedoheptulose 7-phosphate isomerase